MNDDSYGTQPMSMHEALRIVWASKWIVLAASIGLGIAAATWAAFSTKIYRAEIIISHANVGSTSQLASLVGRLGVLAGGDTTGFGGQSTPAENMAVLTSEQFISDFIEANNLLPVLFSEKWDATSNTWQLDPGERAPSLQDGYHFFISEVMSLKEEGASGLVRLSIDWSDPLMAAAWANDIVRRLNGAARAHAIQEATRGIAYLEQELEKTSNIEVRQSIYRLLETQLNSSMLANVREDFAFRVVSAAMPPDVHRPVSPKPVRMVILAMFCGFVLACGAVLTFRKSRARPDAP